MADVADSAVAEFRLPSFVRGHGGADTVNGMLSVEEGEKLAELARDKVVLEIGSWCGLSTIVMARTAKRVYSVDWHRGDREMGGEDTLMEFLDNIRRYEKECCPIIPIIGRCEDVLPLFNTDLFGLIYIDGAHDYESVCRDTAHAMRLARWNGIVVWHDADRSEVQQVMNSWSVKTQRGPGRLAIEIR